MTDIATFLTARFNAEQRKAELAAQAAAERDVFGAGAWALVALRADRYADAASAAISTFVAEWEPPRVLHNVAAKRRVLERHRSYDFPHDPDDGPGDYAWTPRCDYCHQEWPCPDLRDAAASYADVDGYNPAWRPE